MKKLILTIAILTATALPAMAKHCPSLPRTETKEIKRSAYIVVDSGPPIHCIKDSLRSFAEIGGLDKDTYRCGGLTIQRISPSTNALISNVLRRDWDSCSRYRYTLFDKQGKEFRLNAECPSGAISPEVLITRCIKDNVTTFSGRAKLTNDWAAIYFHTESVHKPFPVKGPSL